MEKFRSYCNSLLEANGDFPDIDFSDEVDRGFDSPGRTGGDSLMELQELLDSEEFSELLTQAKSLGDNLEEFSRNWRRESFNPGTGGSLRKKLDSLIDDLQKVTKGWKDIEDEISDELTREDRSLEGSDFEDEEALARRQEQRPERPTDTPEFPNDF